MVSPADFGTAAPLAHLLLEVDAHSKRGVALIGAQQLDPAQVAVRRAAAGEAEQLQQIHAGAERVGARSGHFADQIHPRAADPATRRAAGGRHPGNVNDIARLQFRNAAHVAAVHRGREVDHQSLRRPSLSLAEDTHPGQIGGRVQPAGSAEQVDQVRQLLEREAPGIGHLSADVDLPAVERDHRNGDLGGDAEHAVDLGLQVTSQRFGPLPRRHDGAQRSQGDRAVCADDHRPAELRMLPDRHRENILHPDGVLPFRPCRRGTQADYECGRDPSRHERPTHSLHSSWPEAIDSSAGCAEPDPGRGNGSTPRSHRRVEWNRVSRSRRVPP